MYQEALQKYFIKNLNNSISPRLNPELQFHEVDNFIFSKGMAVAILSIDGGNDFCLLNLETGKPLEEETYHDLELKFLARLHTPKPPPRSDFFTFSISTPEKGRVTIDMEQSFEFEDFEDPTKLDDENSDQSFSSEYDPDMPF